MLAARPPPALLFAVVLGVILFLFVSRDASVPGPSASAAGDPLDARALAASFPPSNCPANPERLKFPVSARRSYPDKHKEVRGWVKPGVPHLFALLAAHQAKLGICGGVAEIGVHHGKLAIILAHTLRKSERMVAVDVFENQALNVDGSGKGDRGIFESNLKKFGIQPNSDVEIISSSSMEVSVQQLESAVGKIRMFSVDGGHTAELTAWDMGLATGACVDGCIVAVDDAMAVYWPGVIDGILRYLYLPSPRIPHGLVPFLLFGNKLFLTTPSYHSVYSQLLEKDPFWSKMTHHAKARTRMAGWAIRVENQSPKTDKTPDEAWIEFINGAQ